MTSAQTPGWVAPFGAALNAYGEAEKRSWADPKDASLEMARWEAAGDVLAVEQEMASEVILMLRKANERSGACLRSLLTDIIGDVIDGKVDELRTDVQDLADAVAALETTNQRKAGRA